MATFTIPAVGITLQTFRAADDGCLGYLVVDTASRTAMAIDPRLDHVDQFTEALRAPGVRLTYALDTHTHADHLSGVRRLAEKTGAAILAHRASKLRIAARRVRGGETFELGATTVTVLDAPGHTPDSLALLVDGPIHGRRPARRRRRADRFYGRKRLRAVRHVPALRGPPRRDLGPPRPRLRGPAGHHHRGGESAQRALPRARPRRAPGAAVCPGGTTRQHGRDPPAQPRRGRHGPYHPPRGRVSPDATPRAVPPRCPEPARVRGRAHRRGTQHPPGRAQCPPGRDPRACASDRRVPHGRARDHRGRGARAGGPPRARARRRYECLAPRSAPRARGTKAPACRPAGPAHRR